MRYLLYFTIAFAMNCMILVYKPEVYIAIIVAVFLLLLCLFWRRSGSPVKIVCCLILGCVASYGWYAGYTHLYLSPVIALDGMTQNVTIRADDYSEKTNYGLRFPGSIIIQEKQYQVFTYLNDQEAITPGTTVTGSFRFRVTTPGGLGESSYYQGKGIFLLAYQDGDVLRKMHSPEKIDIPAIFRRKLQNGIDRYFPEDTAPFAKALLIGDTSDLSYAVDTAFKISGIRHIVAVSGLHVSILFAFLSTITWKRRWLTGLLGFPALLIFAAVAGFSPSVNRACIMCGLMLLAMLADREYDGPTALAFAVLVILMVNPLTITSVSLQLSAGSVMGIYLFGSQIRNWMRSLFRRKENSFLSKWVSSSVSVTLSAMVITTPLCAYYFGMVSLIGPITNLLVLWVVSFIFYGIMGVCALHFLSPAAAFFAAKVIAVPIRYVMFVSQKLAYAPIAAVYTASPYIVAWFVFVYLLLVVFMISRKRKPQTLGCCAVLGLCMALLAGWLEPMRDELRFTVLDVGQGQCLLLQSERRTVMVDCGGDSDSIAADTAAAFLHSQGIPKVDCMILTHLDRDHAGGAANLLSCMNTDILILPPIYSELKTGKASQVVYAAEPMKIDLEGTKIEVYPPTFPGNSNEMSLCILFDTEKCDILITGDRDGFGERALLRNANIPDVDILVAGHHGSKNSTCEELLLAVRPEIVCISAGRENSYGHPAPELLHRLQNYGCTVYRTDELGTFTIRR